MARQLLSDVESQYIQLLNGPYRQQREAARELERLLPSGGIHQFSLQLSAEGYGVDPLRLSTAFARIEQDIQAFQTGLPIAPMQTSVRAILSSMPVGIDCPPPLKDMPRQVSESRSMGSDGAKQKATKADQPKHTQRLQGSLLPFSLMAAPSRLIIIAAAIISLLVVAGVLCRHRIFRIFGRRSRLRRRSVIMDFQVSRHSGDSVDNIPVSSVDISTGGMKIAQQSTVTYPLQVGGQITLHLPGQDVWANIVWSNQFYCGVAFQRRLSNRDFRKIIDEMSRRA